MKYAFEQRPNESARAFAAFSAYLSMGAERSLALVARNLGKSTGLMERWSRIHHWNARVRAHSQHLAAVEHEATEALARGKATEWLQRTQEVRETEWEMHRKCIAAAQKALNTFMKRETQYANLADISRMPEVASKLGRLASGMATDKTELTAEVAGTISIEFKAALEKIYGDVVEGEVVVEDGQLQMANGQGQMADGKGSNGGQA